MFEKFGNVLQLLGEKEDFDKVSARIRESVSFRGTNLWILILAIFIACIGLNVNSTPVIIGAMLISPLMGPILGIGFAMAANEPKLMQLSLKNYFFALVTALAASVLYFLISPLDEAHSEILARTAPNIYDVLIAFFGGCAGMLATGSKLKGNVLPGVAIATALMPPICTAGYGLASGRTDFFLGALYLYLINSVYIALATFLMANLMRFQRVSFTEVPNFEKRSKKILWIISMLTILPSIYLGYNMVLKNQFEKKARHFIQQETTIENRYLLDSEVSFAEKNIRLIYAGQALTPEMKATLAKKLHAYELDNAKLVITQGFSFETKPHNEQSANEKILQLEQKVDGLLRERLQEKEARANITSDFDLAILKQELKKTYPEILDMEMVVARTSDGKDLPNTLRIYTAKDPAEIKKEKIRAAIRDQLDDRQITIEFHTR